MRMQQMHAAQEREAEQERNQQLIRDGDVEEDQPAMQQDDDD